MVNDWKRIYVDIPFFMSAPPAEAPTSSAIAYTPVPPPVDWSFG